jgi:hypothetical protein
MNAAGLPGALLLMPCRLFPVLLSLFFFFHLMSALHYCCSVKAGKGLLVTGFLALATFGNPVIMFTHKIDIITRSGHGRRTTWKKRLNGLPKIRRPIQSSFCHPGEKTVSIIPRGPKLPIGIFLRSTA